MHHTTTTTTTATATTLHLLHIITTTTPLHHTTATTATAPHHTTCSSCGWGDDCNHCSHSKKTQLQPLFGPSVDSLCHPLFTTTNLSYRFPMFETSATALCGTTGMFFFNVRFFRQIGCGFASWGQKPSELVSTISCSGKGSLQAPERQTVSSEICDRHGTPTEGREYTCCGCNRRFIIWFFSRGILVCIQVMLNRDATKRGCWLINRHWQICLGRCKFWSPWSTGAHCQRFLARLHGHGPSWPMSGDKSASGAAQDWTRQVGCNIQLGTVPDYLEMFR